MTKIYFITQGCSLNKSDSETMKGLLEKASFEFTDYLEEADLVIFNTCTVKGPTESYFKKMLAKFEELNKPVIIAGCIAQTNPDLGKKYSLIGVDQIDNIVEVVEETLNGNIVTLIVKDKKIRLNIAKHRYNPVIEIIPISQGCLGDPCSYCKVKEARGELYSYPREYIIRQARKAVNDGVKEIWLTAQDTGCYGYDFANNNLDGLSGSTRYLLPDLVKDIAKLPGDFMIRVGMANPNHVKDFIDDFIAVLKHEKVFKFLHIPVQAGNDDILRKMKRKYTAQDFVDIVEKVRHEIPETGISTDIICGFPSETDDQFKDSVKLIEKIQPDWLHVSKFWARPGTEAASLPDQVSGDLIKKRVSIINSTFEYISFARNKKWVNWTGEVIIEKKGNDDSYIARNYAYRPVIVRGNFKLGEKVKVKVIGNTINYLVAEPIMN